MRVQLTSIVFFLVAGNALASGPAQPQRLQLTSKQVSGGMTRKSKAMLKQMDALYRSSGDHVSEPQVYKPRTISDGAITVTTKTTDLRQYVDGDKVGASLLSARKKGSIFVALSTVDQRTPGVVSDTSMTVEEERGRLSMTREFTRRTWNRSDQGSEGHKTSQRDRSFLGGLFGIRTDRVTTYTMKPGDSGSTDTHGPGVRYLTLFGRRVLRIWNTK